MTAHLALAQDWSWQDSAACRGEDLSVFFPVASRPAGRKPQAELPEPIDPYADARALCAGCPVMQECLESALATRAEGFWGGKDDDERKSLRRRRQRAA